MKKFNYYNNFKILLFTFLIILFSRLSVSGLNAAETFNGASGQEATYSWSIDTNGHLEIYGDSYQVMIPESDSIFSDRTPWEQYADYIKTASVDLKGKSTSLDYMFNDLKYLTDINFRNLDTSYVTSMNSMFYGCSSLKSLDLSGFKNANLTNMYCMFSYCSELEKINFGNFNTSNVISMDYLFNNCSNLKNIDLSSFDTKKVTSMYSMFHGCSSLETLDLKYLNTSNVTDMTYMFRDCSRLTSIDISSFDVSKVTRMVATFRGCKKMEEIDLSQMNLSSLQAASGYGDYIFDDMESLRVVKLPKSPISIRLGDAFYDESGNVVQYAPKNVDGVSIFYNVIYADKLCMMNGHDYSNPNFTWNTYPNVKLVLKCQRDRCNLNHYSCTEVDATVTSVTTMPTTEKEGEITYTAKAEFHNTIYTDTHSIILPKLDGTEQIPQDSSPTQNDDSKSPDEESISKNKTKSLGTTFVIKDAVFKVTKSSKNASEVEYIKSKKKNAQTISIPSNISFDGTTYKVTSIAKNAFKNSKKLTKVTIGKNVTKIGSKAFYGCKKLKTIKINSKKLKSIGKNAFKDIHKKAKIDVPNSKRKAYKKLFKKNTGYKSTMSIK